MIELGLCCTFKEAPIRFRKATVTYLKRCEEPIAYLNAIVADNVRALHYAIDFCKEHQIGAFRVNSQFLPAATHPDVAYTLDSLPDGEKFKVALRQCKGVRLSFHPDQFILLSSPNDAVNEKSILEIEYQTQLADYIGADVINIHGGGAYDSKEKALARFEQNFHKLSSSAKQKLTVENDDKIYTPQDLLPLCRRLGIPFVYDVHHHRCNPDDLSIEEATDLAVETWNRRPLFHLSSPLGGWDAKNPTKHADYIAIEDFPTNWLSMDLTIDIEAKAKELAVLKLQKDLQKMNP